MHLHEIRNNTKRVDVAKIQRVLLVPIASRFLETAFQGRAVRSERGETDFASDINLTRVHPCDGRKILTEVGTKTFQVGKCSDERNSCESKS